MDGSLPRLIAAEPRPRADRPADGAGTTAWPLAAWGDITSGVLEKAGGELLFLACTQQIATQGQGQPQRPQEFEGFDKTDAQDWRLAPGRPGPCPGQQG